MKKNIYIFAILFMFLTFANKAFCETNQNSGNLQTAAGCAEGIVIYPAVKTDSYIIVPKGTILPLVMIDNVSSQTAKKGELFLARLPQNYLTKDKNLILTKNSPVAGQVMEVQKGKYFVSNGKLTMHTKIIRTIDTNREISFIGDINTKNNTAFADEFKRTIFKGSKINIKSGQTVYVELIEPIKIMINEQIAQ